ncbi:ABC transporter related [Candidatus Competibacter denitrificans Run_A_D11]|uniref:ABC transporter related n=1 Tax=Candidatus Competibacter denitrificans Run_A_D11 TaxID=1400863 RepID=W6M6R9_9GAMM|nr:ABC transporter ATP-binding protein [Candidatus Competibacter denitrificans]CDI03387.1 ABC transporter related [Candidatus Competibacter denitrificans Run_A_D11]
MNDKIAIEVSNLGKAYRLGANRRHYELREQIAHIFQSIPVWFKDWPGSATTNNMLWALSDATFKIYQGENVGIIGLNGAGKSTLLKILSRITAPTTGRARIYGRMGAMLEVGTGFHPEQTGRENVYLYGTILGMTRSEINNKFDEILDFSGIGNLIDTPVKRYSSGMYVRLAFAVAAHVEPDVLLLDEVLAVGDLSFQRKCMEYTKRLQEKNATILVVSHNMFSVKAMCQRVIYIKKGRVQFDGPTEEGIRIYEEDCSLSELNLPGSENQKIKLTRFELSDTDGISKNVFEYGERIRITFNYLAQAAIEYPNFILNIVRSDGVVCCSYSTEIDGFSIVCLKDQGVMQLITPPIKLVAELYTIHVIIREKGFQKILCAQIGSNFHVKHHIFDINFGVFYESGKWDMGY